MRGRWLVVAMVALGVVLALVAAKARFGRGATLPLQPGSILLITVGDGALGLGPFESSAVRFPAAHGVSSELAASLAALATSRMPREIGVVREGDRLAPGVLTLAEQLQRLRFTTALFSSSRLSFRESGLGRGAALLFEEGGDPATVATRAANWLTAQERDVPALAWLHVDAWPAATPPTFLDTLASGPLRDRLVIASLELESRATPRLALRVPGDLIGHAPDPREVSLLDVAPTLCELYGVPVPSGWMEPFLLAPRTRAARFFAFAEPLPAPDLDADAVTLLAGRFAYRCDPRATPAESVAPRRAAQPGDPPLAASAAGDDERIRAELRRLLESAFHWRVDARGAARWPAPPR